jgi:hypothetical protein
MKPALSRTARPLAAVLGLAALAAATFPATAAGAPEKPSTTRATAAAGTSSTSRPETTALEPLCAALEPAALRTELARPLGGGKQTVLIPAREDEVLGLTHLSKEEFAATGLDWDQFMTKAADAATRLLGTMKPQVTKDADGDTACIILRSSRPFAASVVLSPELLTRFQDQLGDRLVALIPDRNTIYLFSRNFGKFQDFGPRILKEHAAALYPCSTEAFEISRDGLKCLGAFDGSNDDGEAPNEAAAQPKTTGEKPSPKSEKPGAPPPSSSAKAKPRKSK